MKKFILSLGILALSFGAFAQEQGQFRAQVGLDYGDDTELGINAGIQYFVSDNIAIAPSYSFYLKDFAGIKFSSINLEGRYYFNEAFYGLGGIDIIRSSGTVTLFGTPVDLSASTSEIALGVGYDMSLSDGTLLNFQAKYANQIVLGAGVVFSF